MSAAVAVMLALAGGTFVLKATGPVLLGGSKELPTWLKRLAFLLPAPLLAALVVTSTMSSGKELVVDARVVGLAGAAVALRFKAPFVIVVVVGALATAVSRALGFA